MYAGNSYLLGSPALLQSENIHIEPALQTITNEWLNKAQTVIWLADRENALAAIAIADKIKTTSAEAVKELQAAGIEVYMLTGDNQFTATKQKCCRNTKQIL